MSDYSDMETENESDVEITLEDYLNHPETNSILEDEHFEMLKDTMCDKIENFYKNEVNYAEMHFMKIFNKDYDSKMSYDFFLTIYPFISKNYDISIFERFPNLAKCLTVKKDEETVQTKDPVVFESKIYDWGEKKI